MLNWIVWKRTVYLLKIDLALDNIQKLICHKTQTNSSTWPIDRTLTVTTTPGQRGPGITGNEWGTQHSQEL